jgi:estrone sulfotransferase
MKVPRMASRLMHRALGSGARFPVRPDDTFLTSFPKSGNTWVRFIAANLLWPQEEARFETIEDRVPSIYWLRWRLHARRGPRPRVLKSHEPFSPSYPRVVYVLRDPRSVALSRYHYQIRQQALPPHAPLEANLPHLLGSAVGRLGVSWSEHVLGWVRQRAGSPDFLLLRYEQMLADPLRAATQLDAFLGTGCSAEGLRQAADRTAFHRMGELEAQAGPKWRDAQRPGRDRIPFLRAGQTREWDGVLSPAALEWIEAHCRPAMEEVGYRW